MDVKVGQIVGFVGEHGAIYAAIVTRVDDLEAGVVCLHVFHPESGLMMLHGVEYRDADAAEEGAWRFLEQG